MCKITSKILFLFLTSLVSVAAVAAGYNVTAVQDGATLTGKVVFSGNDPAPEIFAIDKDTSVCGNSKEIDFVKVKDGALMDVVVYLDGVQSGKPFTDNDVEVNQKGCTFLPFLGVVHNQENLTVLNLDPVAHNVHSYELIGKAKRTAFNVNQPDQGSKLTKKIKLRRGNALKLECDQHAFMHAFLFVAKNPYYSLVAEDGTFTITDVPAGNYTVKAWHGTLGEQEANVELASGSSQTITFEFTGK